MVHGHGHGYHHKMFGLFVYIALTRFFTLPQASSSWKMKLIHKNYGIMDYGMPEASLCMWQGGKHLSPRENTNYFERSVVVETATLGFTHYGLVHFG